MPVQGIRKKHNVSRLELANLSGYSLGFLKKLEKGNRNLTPDCARVISKALNDDTVLHECCANCPVMQELIKNEISAGTEIKRKSDKLVLASASL